MAHLYKSVCGQSGEHLGKILEAFQITGNPRYMNPTGLPGGSLGSLLTKTGPKKLPFPPSAATASPSQRMGGKETINVRLF